MEKKIILFGAGKIGKQYLEVLGYNKVFAFCDNNFSGQTVYGKKVISYEELKQIYLEYVVILSVGSKNMHEISMQLDADRIPYETFMRRHRQVLIERGEYKKIENEGIFTDLFVECVKKRSPQVFACVGAATGGYASIASYYMGEDTKIYLFEPIPEYVKVIENIFAGDSRVCIVDKAVSNRSGKLELFATVKPNETSIAHSFTMDKQQTMFSHEYTNESETLTHVVETVVLDEFFDETVVDLMLIDIEGAEVLAIEGMEQLIAQRKTTFFLEVHEPYINAIRADGMEYINMVFKKNGYKIYWCELEEGIDYKAGRGGHRLVPSDRIRWEHCIVTPFEWETI